MVNHDELTTIRERMKEVDSCNQSAFIRKMTLDGYAINVDITPARELISLQRRCVNNLKQIAKHAEEHGVYQTEITELQKGYGSCGTIFKTLETPCETCYAVSVWTSGQFGPKSIRNMNYAFIIAFH